VTQHGQIFAQFASYGDRSPYNVDPMNLGPRVDIAYRTLGNIVIRTGYGIFYEVIKGAASGTGGAALWASTTTRRC